MKARSRPSGAEAAGGRARRRGSGGAAGTIRRSPPRGSGPWLNPCRASQQRQLAPLAVVAEAAVGEETGSGGRALVVEPGGSFERARQGAPLGSGGGRSRLAEAAVPAAGATRCAAPPPAPASTTSPLTSKRSRSRDPAGPGVLRSPPSRPDAITRAALPDRAGRSNLEPGVGEDRHLVGGDLAHGLVWALLGAPCPAREQARWAQPFGGRGRRPGAASSSSLLRRRQGGCRCSPRDRRRCGGASRWARRVTTGAGGDHARRSPCDRRVPAGVASALPGGDSSAAHHDDADDHGRHRHGHPDERARSGCFRRKRRESASDTMTG